MIMIVYPVPDARNAYHPSPSPSSQEKKWRPLVQRAITAFLKEAHIFYFLLILCQSVIWNFFFSRFPHFTLSSIKSLQLWKTSQEPGKTEPNVRRC